MVRTSDFQSGNRGSIPLGSTKALYFFALNDNAGHKSPIILLGFLPFVSHRKDSVEAVGANHPGRCALPKFSIAVDGPEWIFRGVSVKLIAANAAVPESPPNPKPR